MLHLLCYRDVFLGNGLFGLYCECPLGLRNFSFPAFVLNLKVKLKFSIKVQARLEFQSYLSGTVFEASLDASIGCLLW